LIAPHVAIVPLQCVRRDNMSNLVATTSAAAPVLSLLTGAIGGAAALALKEYIAPILLEKRQRKNRENEILRSYVAPLNDACGNLIWRFNEILIDQRWHCLVTTTRPVDYNRYKRVSTLYRIACVIGWIRAIELELNSLPQGAARVRLPLSAPFDQFKSALADGPHVEIHRLEQLCSVLKFSLEKIGPLDKASLATTLEVKLYDIAGDDLKGDGDFINNIDDAKRIEICSGVADFLAQKLGQRSLSARLIREKREQIMACVAYREALIYRDWQNAIGDAIIVADDTSIRRYKLLGFQGFEGILNDGSSWMSAFALSIDDIDFDTRNPNDFRIRQLETLAAAVGSIALAIAKSENSDLASKDTILKAKELAARKPA
jgi:hypothetical protein